MEKKWLSYLLFAICPFLAESADGDGFSVFWLWLPATESTYRKTVTVLLLV